MGSQRVGRDLAANKNNMVIRAKSEKAISLPFDSLGTFPLGNPDAM